MAELIRPSRTTRAARQRESAAAILTRTITLIAAGNPLPVILEAIVRCVEAEHPAMLCSILLLDEAGEHLLHGAAPSLPVVYNDAIDGVRIGPSVGSCGTAAFTRRRVIVEDIQSDPLWSDYKHLAAGADLASCWSEPIRSADGRVLGTFAMYHRQASTPGDEDIKSIEAAAHLAAIAIERRRTEETLAASEARHRLFAENATDMIMLSDADLRLTYISPAVTRMTGYRPELLVGRRVIDLVHPDDAPRLLDVSDRLYAAPPGDEPPRVEYRARHRDGRWLWFETRTSLIRDPVTGEPTGALDVAREISARKALEAELQARTREAQAATEAKSDFLANMSHEIRTPLTAILGFSALLRRVGDMPPEAVPYLQRITTAGEALLSVVNDVLDFSKLDAGLLELDPHPFDPAAFVRETADLVATQAAMKQLSLELDLGEDLPAAVMADSARLRQILLNLMGNAIKFTRAGGVRINARHDAGGQLRIAVSDTGVGVPRDRLDRLFQRFSQVDGSVSRHHGGSGLGLAISKRLAELMGGRIGVDSVEGQGSTFWFTIDAPAVSPLAEDRDEAIETLAMPPRRILVVDDLSVNRDLVRAILSPFGHALIEAASGREAVEIAHRTAFDLILMDLQMPGMDGLAATRAIRGAAELNHATPILALSADVLSGQLAACQAAGMNDHIAKPIDIADLLGKVAQWSEHAVADLDRQGARAPTVG